MLGKKEEGEQLRDRLENFIEGQNSEDKTQNEEIKDDQARANLEEKQAKDKAFIDQNKKVAEYFKEARRESNFEESIRNTMIKEVTCEIDEEYPFEEVLKNATFQIFEEICNFSQDVVTYREWLQKRKTFPMKHPQKPVLEVPSEPITSEGTNIFTFIKNFRTNKIT